MLGVVAYQIDEAGNISSLHSSTITIDRTAPDAPGIDTLAQTNDTTPTITGTGEVGATVTVLADLATDPNGVDGTPETEITDPANRPVVQADGTWEFDSNVTLPEETIALSATQTDPAGNESTAGTGSVEVVFTPPAAPVFDQFGNGEPNESPTNDATPTITGTGEVGATVTVLADLVADPNGDNGIPETEIGTAVVELDGTWSMIPTNPLPPGTIELSATQKNAVGNISVSSGVETIVIDQTPPNPGTLDFVNFTDSGDSNDDITNDSTFDLEVTGEDSDTTIDFEFSVNGGVTWSPTTQAQTDLDDGVYHFRARVTDVAGNQALTNILRVEIDDTDPADPIN